eukprot:m.908752 g.908752  ORF g.908752 m.908752 type:complete len:704 (+) comp23716_c0_seq1:472-2583(+)
MSYNPNEQLPHGIEGGYVGAPTNAGQGLPMMHDGQLRMTSDEMMYMPAYGPGMQPMYHHQGYMHPQPPQHMPMQHMQHMQQPPGALMFSGTEPPLPPQVHLHPQMERAQPMPPITGGDIASARRNFQGSDQAWTELLNKMYFFSENRAAGVPRVPRDKEGWGWRAIAQNYCPITQFDVRLADLLKEATNKYTIVTEDGTKYFQCKECGKKVKGSGDFNKHFRTHTHEKPYPCRRDPNCNKRFSDASTRVRHERSHKNERFECKHCKFQYTRKDNRDRHELSCTGEGRQRSRKRKPAAKAMMTEQQVLKQLSDRNDEEMEEIEKRVPPARPLSQETIENSLPSQRPQSLSPPATPTNQPSPVTMAELAVEIKEGGTDAGLGGLSDIRSGQLGISTAVQRDPSDEITKHLQRTSLASFGGPGSYGQQRDSTFSSDSTISDRSSMVESLVGFEDLKALMAEEPTMFMRTFPKAAEQLTAYPQDDSAPVLPADVIPKWKNLWRQFSDDIYPAEMQKRPNRHNSDDLRAGNAHSILHQHMQNPEAQSEISRRGNSPLKRNTSQDVIASLAPTVEIDESQESGGIADGGSSNGSNMLPPLMLSSDTALAIDRQHAHGVSGMGSDFMRPSYQNSSDFLSIGTPMDRNMSTLSKDSFSNFAGQIDRQMSVKSTGSGTDLFSSIEQGGSSPSVAVGTVLPDGLGEVISTVEL